MQKTIGDYVEAKLYFTEEKICIGSYDEAATYERETKKSYWTSELLRHYQGYNPVGKTMAQIKADRSAMFRAKKNLSPKVDF